MSDSSNKKQVRQKHSSNMNLAENNPCLKEHQSSLKCLDDNNYNQNSCKRQFDNYRACMGFWNKIKFERRQKNIYPLLPPVEEREAIIKEHYGNA